MIRLIFHQIWNQRYQNFWIWLELSLLSVFLWLAVDPLFTTVCVTQMPRGYELEGLYSVEPCIDFRRMRYSTTQNFNKQMDYLLTQLSEHPMVEQVCLCENSVIVGRGWNMALPFYHSREEALADKEQQFEQGVYSCVLPIPVLEGLEKWCDLPGTMGLRDAVTGRPIHARTDASVMEMAYVSEKMAQKFYGTNRAQDSLLYYLSVKNNSYGEWVEEHTLRVGAVCADIRTTDQEIPDNMMLYPVRGFFMHCMPLVRAKAGVDEDTFRAAIERDVLAHCKLDDVKRFKIVSQKEQVRKSAEQSGAYNIIRLRSAMGFFGLLCAFLGVSGLFWVRCNDRRQDMGILRSLGATCRAVRRQMLTEATLLLTLAFVPAMLYIAWHVHANGYSVGVKHTTQTWWCDLAYWFNRPVLHVAAVTAIVYVAMLLITLLATWLPVYRVTRTLPCDTLRDE